MGTVSEVFEATVGKHGDRPAMKVKRGGTWQTLTWRQYRDQAVRVARALVKHGVKRGEGVVILGYNSPEWVLADVGAILAGACPAGIYTTSSPEQCRYIAHHCEARVAFAEGPADVAKFVEVSDRLPALRTIVQMTGEPASAKAIAWSKFLDAGDDSQQGELDARRAAAKPADVCTLIYTSGTTGDPKAVQITHDNVTWIAEASTKAQDFGPDDICVSYLPLSHVAEQIVSIHGPMYTGGTIAFAESLDKLGDALREVRPTFFFGVPRVWEKIQARMVAAGASSPALRRMLVRWARKQGLKGGYAEQRGETKGLGYRLAEKIVFRKARERLGFDRTRACLTGAAPISRDTLEFFLSLGIPILEVYGMSECTGPATLSTPSRYKTGKAGWVVPGTELKIADDGEICMRGRHVFRGYLKDPEATAAAIDKDGWLHSGDIGELDPDGYLRITDRKKELIITAGGENISPQLVEGHLTSIPIVAQAVVIGDRRKYLAALLTLDAERVVAEAEAIGSPARDPAAAARCETFRAHIEKQIAVVNQKLARVQTVKKFAILPKELTIDDGELTPTMKLKRRVILAKYQAEIESLYS